MLKIKLKNPQDLKKKPIKIVGKILTGITIAGLATTLIGAGAKVAVAQSEYYNARIEAQNSGRPQEIALLTGDEKIEEISNYFSEALRQNGNINDEQKEIIIDAFKEYVIENHGNFFTEETITNMYAVASTENFREMTEFAKKHGWWGGDYNSFFNEISTYSDRDKGKIAHEQLHAILKGDFKTTGYANGLYGYGLNEGMTGWLSDGKSYRELTIYAKEIGSIIGYDKLIRNYLDRNIDGLSKDLSQYLTEDESIEVIKIMDEMVFLSYKDTFISKNSKIDSFNQKSYEAYMSENLEKQEKLDALLQKARENAVRDEEFIDLSKLINDYIIINDESDFEYIYRYRHLYMHKGNIKKRRNRKGKRLL